VTSHASIAHAEPSDSEKKIRNDDELNRGELFEELQNNKFKFLLLLIRRAFVKHFLHHTEKRNSVKLLIKKKCFFFLRMKKSSTFTFFFFCLMINWGREFHLRHSQLTKNLLFLVFIRSRKQPFVALSSCQRLNHGLGFSVNGSS
jgi:hypothetical protein